MYESLHDRAWGRILEANEWFDGEPEITEGARQGFEREWRANGPSRVTAQRYGTMWATRLLPGDRIERDFPTRVAAERWVEDQRERLQDFTVTVRSIAKIEAWARAFSR